MNAPHQDTSLQADDTSVPSLEQILQTIRGVISEGENAASSDDVLLLTEILREDGSIVNVQKETVEHSPRTIQKQSYRFPNSTDTATKDKPTVQDTLLSKETAVASAKALNDLLKVASSISKKEPASSSIKPSHALEDLVVELLKPQLKQWLDQNLPSLIEQMVTKEIQKLLSIHKGDHL